MRTEEEISEAELEFYEKVWYGRHRSLEDKPSMSKADRDIRQEADKVAAELEEKYGIEELGPKSDFGWGMLSGKLSALRWVLGDEWDMLDT
jgi:hypothetical protein